METSIQFNCQTTIILNKDLEKYKNLLLYEAGSKTLLQKVFCDKNETLMSGSEIKNAIMENSKEQAPFLKGVHLAYSQHYPFIINPDTFWLTILSSICQHINQNSEKYRKFFVSFEGKKTIAVSRPSFTLPLESNSWVDVIPEFSEKIAEFIPKQFCESVVCDYSTSTKTSIIASQICLMDSASGYLNYEVYTECGIPSITVEGTTQDWIKMKEKLNSFKGIDIDEWLNVLSSLIDEIIKTSNGEKNVEFWNSIYKGFDGSGGITFNGWASLLYLYDFEGEQFDHFKTFNGSKSFKTKPHSFSQFTSRISKVPFIFNDNGKKYDMFFSAGANIITQDQKTQAISIEPFWVITNKV